jgi:hypothetical protein
VFKSLGGLCPCPINNLESLPVPATTPAATTFSTRELADSNKLTKTTTTTTKEVISRE